MENAAVKLILATTNKGKVQELAPILGNMGIELQSMRDYPEIGPIEENGKTFAQNALSKARTVCAKTKCLALADDSGLEVYVLNGRPGIFSARFGDDIELLPGETVDQRNMRKLLAEMEGVPQEKRGCRFVCAMALVRPDGRELTLEAYWEGFLLTTACGTNGFGYDPLFYDPLLKTSAAMLTTEEKNLVSHRGKALRQMIARMPHFLELPPLGQ